MSYSYGNYSGSPHMITIVSTNKDFINAHAEQYREYLAMCRPALKLHKEPSEYFKMTLDFFELGGDICQKILPLSPASMSAELFAEQCVNRVWKEMFRKVAQAVPRFEKRMDTHMQIDISPLCSVKEIMSGKVAVASPYPNADHPFYTAETYIMHLKNILRLMDEHEGYIFIPIDTESYQGYNLMVNDGGIALLPKGGRIPR